jgi:hypothetical protein
MAEAAKPHTAVKSEEKKEQTPEEKLNEENAKKNEERVKAVNKAVDDVLAVAKEQNEDPQVILDELKGRIASVATVAAGAQYGPTPDKVAELVEKHTPYIYPREVVEKGSVKFNNIMEHEPYLETAEPTGKKGEPKKAA